ncbi:hypothetical protein SAMN05518672_105260 [Chitinophaga sp. CF118]|uniref:hypothetical protein n=1 Tax=Chitinophaga sp. CF118 TaxID=1884367 RepID=UPI0008F03C01|nr:hypothetical protein [Chitinophaga sp. CF118]SFE31730.1 hypothetical protein SAMN05518672_105260 [Chitinophaga sp. CF118]
MKHVLIPTDFSIRSLRVLHSVVEKFGHEPLTIVMMHALRMPTSITDLMMLSRRSAHYDLITEDYKDACEIIRNKYASSIHLLKTEFLFGNTSSVFRNFLQYQNIDVIACAATEEFRLAGKDSYNPATLISKSKYPVYKVPLKQRKEKFLVSAMSELFEV